MIALLSELDATVFLSKRDRDAGEPELIADLQQRGWQMRVADEGTLLDMEATTTVFAGEVVSAINAAGAWKVELLPPEPFPTDGYVSLRFAIHPGDVRDGDMNVVTNGRIYPRVSGLVGLGLLGLEKPEWQEVEIPLATLRFDDILTDLGFSGNWTGTFYTG